MNEAGILQKLYVQTDAFRYGVKLVIKRMADIIVGLIGTLTLLPLYCIIKICYVKNHDFSPIFFKQYRIGKDGRRIAIYKFRSMIPNAEAELERLMREDEKIRKEYLKNKKLKNDPRITKIGKFLRKTSLDEFPQFFNVLRGNMSFVGPRPYLPREKKDMGNGYSEIIKVKPGITGPWQVSGRSNVSFKKRVKMDVEYANNWGLRGDIKIAWKTVSSVLRKNGAK